MGFVTRYVPCFLLISASFFQCDLFFNFDNVELMYQCVFEFLGYQSLVCMSYEGMDEDIDRYNHI